MAPGVINYEALVNGDSYCQLGPTVLSPPQSLAALSTLTIGGSLGAVSGAGRIFSLLSPGTTEWRAAWVLSLAARSGKAYFEVVQNSTYPAGQDIAIGLMAQSAWNTGFGGYYPPNPLSAGFYGMASGTVGGSLTGTISNGSLTANAAYNVSAGDNWGVAIDFGAFKMWYRQNGGSWVLGDPVAGTNPSVSFTSGAFDPYVSFYQLGSATQTLTCNFKNTDWAYPAPTGYSQLPY